MALFLGKPISTLQRWIQKEKVIFSNSDENCKFCKGQEGQESKKPRLVLNNTTFKTSLEKNADINIKAPSTIYDHFSKNKPLSKEYYDSERYPNDSDNDEMQDYDFDYQAQDMEVGQSISSTEGTNDTLLDILGHHDGSNCHF